MTHLVEHYGGIWRMSDISYTRLLRKIANHEEWDLNGMGTFLGSIDSHLTHLTADWAKNELAEIKLRARRSLSVVR